MTVYANEVTPDHVGRRVTIRHRLVGQTQPSGRPMHTDVVGDLVAADETTFVVRRRSGEEVTVVRADVVATRLLPPALPRRRPRRS